jgi:hypothetical protein
MVFKHPLLKKAAPQFPPISVEEAKAALASLGFSEKPSSGKEMGQNGYSPRGGYWKKYRKTDVITFHEKDQYSIYLDNTAGCWSFHNSKSRMGSDGSSPRSMLAKVKDVLRTKKQPAVTPVVLSSFEETRANSGVYYDKNVGTFPDEKANRYTLFIGPGDDPDADAYEEIDVDAKDTKHAKEIGIAAMKEDYQPGMIIKNLQLIGSAKPTRIPYYD